ncbi:conserved Plasmodium protein, unknown function [Plasmodium gallinaceum]|uniref:Uncharacterized protein n=1 Tax=Plasmodium gallinaceum TaxID=5849 RepID=A0A1J1GWM8_PLAGA|nr:conserved Plasmodium protein, unknown function [Plasmodium gallinaceum]CRG96879.1 conserved Plasmodium protein, unknown function [Plasmodium gallinaceum]
MKNNKDKRFDILPPPLEKINKKNENFTKVEKKENSNLFNGNFVNVTEKNTHMQINLNDIKKNDNSEIKKENSYISQKYSNIILNSDEINMIISRNNNFKDLIENKKVNDFMNDYLTNPLDAIKKYQKDDKILKFLEILFQYMNAKSDHIHLKNLSKNFSFQKKY